MASRADVPLRAPDHGTVDPAKPPLERSNRIAFWFIVLVGCAYMAALILKVDGLNGPYYWPRGWTSLPLLPAAAWLALPMLPFVAALYPIERRPERRPLPPLALLALASVGLQLGALFAHGGGLARLAAIVASPLATSYYSEASVIQAPLTWLAQFHQAQLGLHSSAIALGAVLALAVFFAWNLLALGAFLGAYGLFWLWQARATAAAWRSLFGTGVLAAATMTAIYLLFGVCTGYDPLRSFQHAIQIQALQAVPLGRLWLDCALLDPFDFLLGAGMLAAPLLLLFVLRIRTLDPRQKALSLSALATILIVDLSGLLRAETARVWIFLLPFAIVPAALELMRFDPRRRALLFALQGGILLTLAVRLSFINP